MRKVSEEQIELEAKSGYKPLAIDSGIALLPLAELGDREFELLCYLLVKEEVEAEKYKNITAISLMQGVAERGRDCSLYNKGTVSGLIQCKKLNARMSKPPVLKEIIKFLLFSILDDELLPDPNNFEYHLYLANDLSEPANTLFQSYNTEIEKEISSGNIDDYVKIVVKDYEAFKSFIGEEPIGDVISLLRKIKISFSNSTDLTARIYKNEKLLSLFFDIRSVVDLASADKIVRSALDDYGLKFLTDEDLKVLQDRISNTKEDNRINLGFVDFFGYSKEFFKFLNGEPFKEIAQTVMNVTALLDKQLFNFIQNEISKLCFEKVTKNLLRKRLIHPFSVGLAQPYLFKRLSVVVMLNKLPKAIADKHFPDI
ncbi:hypothetical protein VHTUMSATKI_11760 [Vibrio harveyi]|uniref:hypothetical protein n=1 Tax=Vibrio harveyi TaxID=669 RepID=UPI0036F3695D